MWLDSYDYSHFVRFARIHQRSYFSDGTVKPNININDIIKIDALKNNDNTGIYKSYGIYQVIGFETDIYYWGQGSEGSTGGSIMIAKKIANYTENDINFHQFETYSPCSYINDINKFTVRFTFIATLVFEKQFYNNTIIDQKINHYWNDIIQNSQNILYVEKANLIANKLYINFGNEHNNSWFSNEPLDQELFTFL